MPSDIYASTLSSTMHEGHALWYPEPHETGEVQIGDVGFIDDGSLVRLFNVDTTRPEYTVTRWPEAYKPSPMPSNALPVEVRQNALSPGTYKSRGVEENAIEVGIPAGAASSSAGHSVRFECKEERGAILHLKSPATKCTVYDNKRLRDYVAKNYSAWVNFASEELAFQGVERRIILVYGWIKTSPDWIATVFANHGAKLTATIDAQGTLLVVNAGLEASRQRIWEGPVISRLAIRDSSILPAKQDQCIFLKYYSVKPRKWFFPTRIEANAGPHQLPGREGEGRGPEVRAEDAAMEIQPEGGSGSEGYWPSFVDILLDYILEFSDAEIALGCDEDISTLLLDQEWPHGLALYLRQTRPRIEVDDKKCGMLSIYDAICRQRLHTFTSRTTEDRQGQVELPKDQTRAGNLVDGRVLLGPSQMNTTSLDWPHMYFKHKDTENGAITCMSLSPDGTLVAASWNDTIVTVWRLKDGLIVQVLGEQGHIDTVWTIAFSPNSEAVVSVSADTSGIVWDIATGHAICRLEGHTADVMAVAFDPFGKVVATGSADYTVKVWHAVSGALLHNLTGHISDIMTVAFSPNGNRLASCADSDVILWDPHSGTRVMSLQGHVSAIWCMAWSAAGERLITGSEDKSSRIWDVESGDQLVTFPQHTNSVWSVVFSPDGNEVASASYDATVVTCDSYTGEQRHVFSDSQMSSVVEAVAYSTRGDLIASGSADGHVRVWNAHSGEFIAEFQGHEEKVKNVQFTPDDKDVVSCSEDGTIRVWSVLDAQRLLPSSIAPPEVATS